MLKALKMPPALAVHRLTPAQLADVASKVKLVTLPGKGMGLVARRDLPAHTRVGVYGGKVYSTAAHRRLSKDGTTSGKYAVDFFRRGSDNQPKEGFTLEPGAGDGMHPTHANVLAAFINEPGTGQTPNVLWVRNYGTPRERLELWTSRRVRRGEELTACYGSGYPRRYATPCTSKPGHLHYVDKAHRVPTLA